MNKLHITGVCIVFDQQTVAIVCPSFKLKNLVYVDQSSLARCHVGGMVSRHCNDTCQEITESQTNDSKEIKQISASRSNCEMPHLPPISV
jgi:mannose/fructose/N-acetylgalactosamine-specific phosphotransferase system component IIB